jgi:parallel beta-helix repeat protein
MSKKKKKKSRKERQRERQIKQQKAREAYRIQRERKGKRKLLQRPKGKILVAVCLLALIVGAYLIWQYIKPLEELPPQSGVIYIKADGSVDPSNVSILNVENVYYTFTADIHDSIVIERDNIVVDGANYTLQATGGSTSDGIDLTGRSNVTIKNMKIQGFGNGFHLEQSSNNTLSGNTITGNQFDGIVLRYSSDNILSGNTVANNQFDGVYLSYSSSNTLGGNTITGNQFDGLHLELSSSNTLSENRILNNHDDGAHIRNSSYNTLSGNTVANNDNSSVNLYSVSHSVLSQNDLTGNKDGIVLRYSSDNTLSENTVANNDNSGIYLYSVSHSVLSQNDLTSNYFGIVLEQSSSNTLNGNTITNNLNGLVLYKSSHNSNYNNNFIDNTGQVYSNESTNVWDDGYPFGGNYWSDYNGTDLSSGPHQNQTGSDGIGDTFHIINASDTDNYPLIGMFHSFNATLEHAVQTICNSTISGFQFNGTAISFNIVGEDATTGFCRISIPTALMNGNYKVFVNGVEVPYTLLPFSNSTHSYLYFTYNHPTHEIVIIS